MVTKEIARDGNALFLCEFCESAYRDIMTAERCEEHCGTQGYASVEIRRKAVRLPKIEVVPTQ